ncbi:putative molybdenum cofactor guanylyltransferase [Paenibacillus endophyticus]
MIARQLERMHEICDELIVVTHDPKPFLHIVNRSLRIITDFYDGHGPLRGLHGALSLATYASVWVVGCDMPFISSKAAELLLERKRNGFEAAVPQIAGVINPLHVIHDRAFAAHIIPLLQQGETQLSALLEQVFWSELDDRYLNEKGVCEVHCTLCNRTLTLQPPGEATLYKVHQNHVYIRITAEKEAICCRNCNVARKRLLKRRIECTKCSVAWSQV